MRKLLAVAPLALALLTPTAVASKPEGDRTISLIRIDKSDHVLELVAGDEVVERYAIAIGPGGEGPKQYEGDRRTPVGEYRVTGLIKGLFHNFLVVSYPNQQDRARYAELKAQGKVPAGRSVGFGIGIHGGGTGSDWTLGCVALEDGHIDEVIQRVRIGTRIVITD
jgi:murein L,D-transpeptidase YafK